MSTENRIVVRGEHTPEATAALRWALREAERTGGDVLVVQAFDKDRRADLALERDLARARRDARYRAQAWVVETVADLDSTVPITVSTPEGPVDRCLLDAARDAALVVLGDTDPGLELLLGRSASCRVVAVPAASDGRPVDAVPALS